MKNNKQYTKNRWGKLDNPKTQFREIAGQQHGANENRPTEPNFSGGPDATSRSDSSICGRGTAADQFQRIKGNIPPRTASEKLMASIWVDILKLKEISMRDNFFDHGRDSYLAMEVVARVRKVFDVNLSVRALFEDPTVAGMTEAVLRTQHPQRQVSASVKAASSLWNSRK